jgi:hypothetical protein
MRYGTSAWLAHDVVLPRLLERLNDFGRELQEQILVIAAIGPRMTPIPGRQPRRIAS